MKRLFFLVVSFWACVSTSFAEYTVDGRDKSAEQEVVSASLSAGWLIGDFCFHRSVVDFDTVYSLGIIEKHYHDYAQYPEDGVLMIKLGNEEVLKLFRAPVPMIRNCYYEHGASQMTYWSKCLYRLEPGMFDKIVENGIVKFRVQYLNNRFVDEEIKPKKVVKQKAALKQIKAKFDVKAEDNF